MRNLPLISAFLFTILSAPSAWAMPQSVQQACEGLDRPNIDCGCVARRVAAFDRVSPTPELKEVVEQGYYRALGLDNRHGQAFEAMAEDPMAMLMAMELYDQFGGLPENVSDYERGCVIEGAPVPEVALLRDTPAAANYVAACNTSTGDPRYCACTASRAQSRLAKDEFEAYFRSFSDYSDGDAMRPAEMADARGKSMGISGAEFRQLEQDARAKLAPHQEADAAYCGALLWADQEAGLDAEARADAGFAPGMVAAMTPQAEPSIEAPAGSGGPLEQARSIAAGSCAQDGNSDQYCACFMDAFESQVVQRASSPSVVLAWTMMGTSVSSLSTMQQMNLMQSLEPQDQQAAAMLFTQTMDIADGCSQGPAPAVAALEGAPRERMMQICISENEDEALCECMVDGMEGQFSPDDFELIVDMREAEYQGAEDPLGVVASQRGLSASEAEEALANNPAIMAGTMAMASAAMQCIGGIPDMPAMPMPAPNQ